MIDWSEYVKLMVTLLAIADVPGSVPMFVQQTASMRQAGRYIVAFTAGIATIAILLCFAFFGETLLEAFGITIAAFKVIGGVVLLLIALQLLGLTPQIGGVGTAQTKVNPIAIGIFPMAVPLYAGPGTISTVMVYAHEETHSSHDLIVTLLIATVGVVIIVGLLAATMVSRLLGPLTQQVIDRLLGMIVGALGIEFILEGVETYFQL